MVWWGSAGWGGLPNRRGGDGTQWNTLGALGGKGCKEDICNLEPVTVFRVRALHVSGTISVSERCFAGKTALPPGEPLGSQASEMGGRVRVREGGGGGGEGTVTGGKSKAAAGAGAGACRVPWDGGD